MNHRVLSLFATRGLVRCIAVTITLACANGSVTGAENGCRILAAADAADAVAEAVAASN